MNEDRNDSGCREAGYQLDLLDSENTSQAVRIQNDFIALKAHSTNNANNVHKRS